MASGSESQRGSRRSFLNFAGDAGEERIAYESQLELILTLVSFAVGLGNIWRFPYLVYENGGGTFLIPYTVALLTLGIPLFVMELGFGQMLRQGTVNMWVRLGLPKLRGVGSAATTVTWITSVYYVVIISWTVFFITNIFISISSGILPWEDARPNFTCEPSVLIVNTTFADKPDLFTGEKLFNSAYREQFFCPKSGLPNNGTTVPPGYSMLTQEPSRCPGNAAISYWNKDALQKSDRITDLGGINYPMLAAHTVVWVMLYICVFRGVAISGKLAYVTATLPYFCLVAFFFGSIFLENAGSGLRFYLTPDFSKLWEFHVWQKAAIQIFYSIGVGWGGIVAFGSYSDKTGDFYAHVMKVALINCGTSVFAGFVVFSILGFLANEMSQVNPCFSQTDISALEAVGLQGSGLAFVAFPIAMTQMRGKFFWAIVFFVMLFTLGIGSGFGFVESVVTVLNDSQIGGGMARWKLAGIVCFVSWAMGILFITRAGDHWIKLCDSYTTVLAVFFVSIIECAGLMWLNSGQNYTNFLAKTKQLTGRELPGCLGFLWKWFSPAYMIVLTILSFGAFDLTGNAGAGLEVFPTPILLFGWFLGALPVIMFMVPMFLEPVQLPNRPEERLDGGLDPPLDKLELQPSED